MYTAQPVRPASFALADLYPETKGPMPSTSQLGNPHEVAAARSSSRNVLTGPPLNDPRRLLDSPIAMLALLALALILLGMRKG